MPEKKFKMSEENKNVEERIRKYAEIRRMWKEIENKEINFETLEDFYVFTLEVLKSFTRIDKSGSATTLAKTIVILSQIFNVSIERYKKYKNPIFPSVIPTIHFYGTEVFGNKEITQGKDDGIFCVMNSIGKENTIMTKNGDKLNEIVKKYKSYQQDFSRIVLKILSFGDHNEIINLSYNVLFDRKEYNPSHNIFENEASNEVVTASIIRNILRANSEKNKLIPRRSHYPPATDKEYIIKETKNKTIEVTEIYIDAGVEEDLKKGVRNNLIVCIGICILNKMGIRTGKTKKGIENLLCALSPYYIKYVVKETNNKAEEEDVKIIKSSIEKCINSLENQGVIKKDDRDCYCDYFVRGDKIRVKIDDNIKEYQLPGFREVGEMREKIKYNLEYIEREGFLN